jgi:hypothetical protein
LPVSAAASLYLNTQILRKTSDIFLAAITTLFTSTQFKSFKAKRFLDFLRKIMNNSARTNIKIMPKKITHHPIAGGNMEAPDGK